MNSNSSIDLRLLPVTFSLHNFMAKIIYNIIVICIENENVLKTKDNNAYSKKLHF